jgi:preprotein translocase subunit YajC|tara:strand:- start:1016 stop:1234 length:219 start_codon:yes stop_codon:yes gene_type:complete
MSNLNVGDKVVILDGNESGVVTAITEDNKIEVLVHGTIKVVCESNEVSQLLLEVDPNPSRQIDPNTPNFLSE